MKHVNPKAGFRRYRTATPIAGENAWRLAIRGALFPDVSPLLGGAPFEMSEGFIVPSNHA
jgi:hypothetical protein